MMLSDARAGANEMSRPLEIDVKRKLLKQKLNLYSGRCRDGHHDGFGRQNDAHHHAKAFMSKSWGRLYRTNNSLVKPMCLRLTGVRPHASHPRGDSIADLNGSKYAIDM